MVYQILLELPEFCKRCCKKNILVFFSGHVVLELKHYIMCRTHENPMDYATEIPELDIWDRNVLRITNVVSHTVVVA